MNPKTKVILGYLASWVIICLVIFLALEPLLNILLPGIHGVEHWLTGMAIGVLMNTALVAFLLYRALKRTITSISNER